MNSFYDMIKLMENYPGAPEDFDAVPGPEEDFQGQQDYQARQEYEQLYSPQGIRKMKQDAERMVPDDAQAVRSLWRMFSKSFPVQQEGIEMSFAVFDAMLSAVSQYCYYPGEADWSNLELEGLDPEWLKQYELY